MIANSIHRTAEAVQALSHEPAVRETGPLRTEIAAATVSEGQIREAARQINAALRYLAIELRYGMDEATRKLVVRMVDSATGEILRQIPPEEILAIVRGLDRMQGLLLDRKA